MLKVNTIQCPSCKDVLLSRCRHDMRWCTCGATAIDGGFDYTQITSNVPIEITVSEFNLTKQELYDDWNSGKDRYGLFKWPEE